MSVLEISRVDRIDETYNLAPLFPDLNLTGATATVALLAVGRKPTGATVWFSTPLVNGSVTPRLAGPDADPTGAVAVPGTSEIWAKVATTDGQVDAAKIGRINVLGGGALLEVPANAVVYGTGAGGALSGSYPNPGLNETTVDSVVAGKVGTLGSATDVALRAAFAALPKVAATVTASGALVVNKHNPVDASGGAKTMTLPTGQTEGTQVSVEKTDASTNSVTITGSIRGVGSSSISLPWQNEALLLRADSTGSWWPISGHKTKTALDVAYGRALPSYAGARSRPFDNLLSVYGGSPTTRVPIRYAISKALAGNSLVPILFMGDSATAGWKATPGKDDPVMQFRNLLKSAGYPVTGGWVFPSNGTTTTPDIRWTTTGTWQGLNNTDNNYMWTSQSGATATFTSDLPGTVAEFALFAGGTVTVNYSIDGGATTPYAITAGSMNKVQVTGLANTTHTITITTTSTATVWVAAARVRATTGVSVSNGGIFGSRANQWVPTYNTSAFYNPINLTLGLENPALVVVGLGGNEASHAGNTVAGLTSSLVTIGQTVQAKCPVVMQTYLSIDDSVISALYPGMTWGDWVKGMYDAADTLGAMLIDHSAQMGTNAALITAGLMYTDKLHPLPPGYADVARRNYHALAAAG